MKTISFILLALLSLSLASSPQPKEGANAPQAIDSLLFMQTIRERQHAMYFDDSLSLDTCISPQAEKAFYAEDSLGISDYSIALKAKQLLTLDK